MSTEPQVQGPAWYLRIPPPVWTLSALAAAYGIQNVFPAAAKVYFTSLQMAALLGGSGLALAVWGERTFAAAGTEIMPASPANKVLVESGPFRFTRNPMYSGLLLVALGIALVFGTLPFYAVPVVLFGLCNFAFIPFEEAKMQRQFDSAYLNYRARVRRWI